VRFIRQLRLNGFKIACDVESKLHACPESRQVAFLVPRAGRWQHDRNGTTRETRRDTFLVAARLLGVQPARAVVIEDAISGVEAALMEISGL
jgi:beta-phosphoglucomutase-like phosphatase (HAD superfamily)